MADELYYQHGGQQHGPVTGAELKELAAAGKLLPDDLIRKGGMEKWVPARNVKGLFPLAPAPRPAATPNRGQTNENVQDDSTSTRKVVSPARTAKSLGATQKSLQAEPSEPLPLPDEEDDDGHKPKTTRWGKTGSATLLDKCKGIWRRSKTPAKVGILSGVGVLVGMLVLVPVLLLTGGKSSSGGSDASRSGSSDTSRGSGGQANNREGESGTENFTERAERVLGKKANVKGQVVVPRSREDFIRTLRFMGATIGDEVRHKDRVWMQARFSCKKDTYHQIFGQPERLPDGVDTVGTMVIEFQRWQHQCQDGTIVLAGNVLDAQEIYSVNVIDLK